MRGGRRRRWWWGAVVALMVLIGTGVTARSIHDRQWSSAPYTATGESRSDALGWCVQASLSATVSGVASASQPDVLGWHHARVRSPSVTVAVVDCATRQPAPVERLVVRQYWHDASCHLAAVADDDTDDATGEDADEDVDGWQLQTGTGDCDRPVAVGVSTGDGSWLSVDDDSELSFAGRTWSRSLCMEPAVHVTITVDQRAVVKDVPVPPACVSRG